MYNYSYSESCNCEPFYLEDAANCVTVREVGTYVVMVHTTTELGYFLMGPQIKIDLTLY